MEPLSRRQVLTVAGVSSFSLLAGCQGVSETAEGPPMGHPVTEPATEWNSFRGDRFNTGYAKGAEGPESDPSVSWTVETDGMIWGSPVVADGLVFVGSTDHHLYAIDAESGDIEWTVETDGRVEATPAVYDGIVCVGSFDNHAYGIDAATGEIEWQYESEVLIRGSPTVHDGVAYMGVGCLNLICEGYADQAGVEEVGAVTALDIHTGELSWSHPIPDEVISTPAVTDETVITGASNGTLYALDADNGRIDWTYDANEMIWSSPSVAFDTVFFGDWNGLVHAVDLASGEKEWIFDTGGHYISASTAIDEEKVYIGMTPQNHFGDPDLNYAEMIAIDRETGDERWRYDTEALEIGSSAVVTDSGVYMGTHAPSETDNLGVYGISHEGELLWFLPVPGRGVGTSPALGGGRLYVGGSNGNIYAIE